MQPNHLQERQRASYRASCKETLKSSKVGTVDQAMEEHPAPYDSKANGAVGNAAKQVQGLARSLKIALERAISQTISFEHPVIAWMVGHVALVLTTRRVNKNGLTVWQHLRGRQFVRSLMCVGARCLWQLLGKGPIREEPGKFQPIWKRAIFMCFVTETSEYII